MSTDPKKAETVLIPPFSPDQAVLVGPFTTEEITIYEVAPLKITISKTARASHAVMVTGTDPASETSKTPPDAVSPFAATMKHLMKHLETHPEDLEALIAKLQELAN